LDFAAKMRGFETQLAYEVDEPLMTRKGRRSKVRWYRLRDVMLYFRERELAEGAAAHPARLDGINRLHAYIRTQIVAPPGDLLITVAEAAQMLGVCNYNVGALVRKGRLFAWQKKPGRTGSRMWLSANQVRRYSHNPARLKAREACFHGPLKRDDPDYNAIWRDDRGIPEKDELVKHGIMKVNFGRYYSSGQVAAILRVHPSCVYYLRIHGKLKAYKRDLFDPGEGRRTWWFYRKEDVHAFRDALFEKRRVRKEKLRSRVEGRIDGTR
ncbi:MAG: helix-turn-helix domain-containing protein, partial [Chthonomonadales bacterium]